MKEIDLREIYKKESLEDAIVFDENGVGNFQRHYTLWLEVKNTQLLETVDKSQQIVNVVTAENNTLRETVESLKKVNTKQNAIINNMAAHLNIEDPCEGMGAVNIPLPENYIMNKKVTLEEARDKFEKHIVPESLKVNKKTEDYTNTEVLEFWIMYEKALKDFSLLED